MSDSDSPRDPSARPDPPDESVPSSPSSVRDDAGAPQTSTAELRERMLADVVRDSEARETEWVSTPPDGVSVRRLVLTGVALVVAVWLWVLPPSVLRAPPVPRTPEARLEAGTRFAIALQAERIRALRLDTRRLPDLLREAGDTLPGLVYDRVDGGTFVLRGTVNGQVLEYRSDRSLREFLGRAPWILAEAQEEDPSGEGS